jgi:sec-independent protein translocase protein TatA
MEASSALAGALMGPIGMQEMIAIFVIALVLFGPRKLPELGRTLGKALSEFRRAKNELKSTFESHLHELERETRVDDTSYSPKDYHSPARYPYSYDDYNNESTDSSSSESQPSTIDTSVTPQTESQPAVEPKVESGPVADTVPRNNGVHPIEPASVVHNEEHPV